MLLILIFLNVKKDDGGNNTDKEKQKENAT